MHLQPGLRGLSGFETWMKMVGCFVKRLRFSGFFCVFSWCCFLSTHGGFCFCFFLCFDLSNRKKVDCCFVGYCLFLVLGVYFIYFKS